jgi:hypothetical protein
MFSVGGLASIEKEAAEPKTKLLLAIKGKTCTVGVAGASVVRCLGFYPPLPKRV